VKGKWASEGEATTAAASEARHHRAGRLWAKARTQPATRPMQWTLVVVVVVVVDLVCERERDQKNFLSLQLCFSSHALSLSLSDWGGVKWARERERKCSERRL
jgi:hypothetical protein